MADGIWPGARRTRREAIKQGLVLMGAAGAGALVLDPKAAFADGTTGSGQSDGGGNGNAGNGNGGDGANGNPGAGPGTALSFTATGLDVVGPGYLGGTLPDTGQQLVITGNLFDAGGSAVGQLVGTYLQLVPFGQAGPTDPVSLFDEVLNLTDGTICGRGIGGADLDAPTSFAITGGTGHYAGLKGTYTGAQHFLSLGGDGSAQFTFTTIGEGSHGS